MKGAATGEEARATMSLRPSERAKVRRSSYKVAVDAGEGRRRCEDNMVEIRKSRHEEILLKKHRDSLPPSAAATADGPLLRTLAEVGGFASDGAGGALGRQRCAAGGNHTVPEAVIHRLSPILLSQ